MTDAQSRLDIIDDGDNSIRVSGEIDAHSAAKFAEGLRALNGAGDRRVDMSGVEFMDSSGLRVLIDAHQEAEKADARLLLLSPGRVVTRIIEVSGLDDHLHVESTEV